MRSRNRFAWVLLFLAALPLAGNEIQVVPMPVVFMGKPSTGIVRPVVGYMVGTKLWTTTTNSLAFVSASSLQAQGFENKPLPAGPQ